MASLSDRIPEPTASWTVDHDPNPLEGVVVARREVHSEKYDRDFSVLEIGSADGRIHEVMCGRADLAAFVRRYDPQEGDVVALKHWGQQGLRNVYTGIVDAGGKQGVLEVADPLEETPPLTDDDFSPEASS